MKNNNSNTDIVLSLSVTVCLLAALMAVFPTGNIALMVMIILVMLANLTYTTAKVLRKSNEPASKKEDK
ncbi:hypothetical protein [Pseudoscardovia suis]|uniref:hypothetical protein n=1 Tax=Pseudoscardovia suis TaxID=987063 RepID=UPI003F95D767